MDIIDTENLVLVPVMSFLATLYSPADIDTCDDVLELERARTWSTTPNHSGTVTSLRAESKPVSGAKFIRVKVGSELERLIGDTHFSFEGRSRNLMFVIQYNHVDSSYVDVIFQECKSPDIAISSFSNFYLTRVLELFSKTEREVALYTDDQGQCVIECWRDPNDLEHDE